MSRVAKLNEKVRNATDWSKKEKLAWLSCEQLDAASLKHLEKCLKYLRRKVRKDKVIEYMQSQWNGPMYDYNYLIAGGRPWKYLSKDDFPKYTIEKGPPALRTWWANMLTDCVGRKRIVENVDEKVNLLLKEFTNQEKNNQ